MPWRLQCAAEALLLVVPALVLNLLRTGGKAAPMATRCVRESKNPCVMSSRARFDLPPRLGGLCPAGPPHAAIAF